MDDHDLLIRMDEKMDAVLLRLRDSDKAMGELSKRVSVLEGFKSTIMGVVAVISLLVSMFVTWLMSYFRIG